MKPLLAATAVLALCCLTGPAGAQSGPTYTAEELANILQGGANPKAETAVGTPVFSAEELANILRPGGQTSGVRTRGLSAGSGVEPGTSGSGVVPDLRVNFEVNSFALTSDSQATLDQLAIAMQMDQLQALEFEIGGHTDASGSAKYNQRLSEKRAASVVDYLLAKGVRRERLTWIGHGEEQLFDPARPKSGANRRVEVRTRG